MGSLQDGRRQYVRMVVEELQQNGTPVVECLRQANDSCIGDATAVWAKAGQRSEESIEGM